MQQAAPIDIAIRHISETRRLVESLITSSESFDYVRAKAALNTLRSNVRVLARVQAELIQRAEIPSEAVIRFPGADAIADPGA
jgi:hypothetical protein